MLVPMTKVRIIGRRDRLVEVLDHLYSLRLVELADIANEPRLALGRSPGDDWRAARREELRLLLAQLDGLLELAGARPTTAAPDGASGGLDLALLRADLEAMVPEIEELTGRVEALFAEQVVVGRYVGLLRRILELVPELSTLDAPELAALRLGTMVVMLGTEDDNLARLLGTELQARLGDRFLLVSAPVEGAIGCVIVYPADGAAAVQDLLDRRRVRQLPLPEPYKDLSLSASVEAMEQRLGALPAEIDRARAELEAVIAPRLAAWMRAREALAGHLEKLDAVAQAGTTERVFVVLAWLPRDQLRRLRDELDRRVGPDVVVEELAASRHDPMAPVALRNRRPARSFEFLVRFYDDPRARSIDPTGLLAVFVPIMFGLMVGDVVYGALLLIGALWLKVRFGSRSAAVRDGARILAMGSAFAIVFGFVFGEALGDLGERAFGMPALWRHRDDAAALQPLLLFALAIGIAHVVLGYVLALVQSWQDRAPRSALAPAGSLLVLAALLAAAGAAAEQLPTSALGPAGAAALVGLVIVSAEHGWIGLVLGPLELIGTIGHVLSYLRLAAVGLASVYLAVVANQLASVGPIWLGVVVAAFLHALNLVLAGFTPAIQSLRLQYVEFFSKFFIGGGRSFRPFGPPDHPRPPRHVTPRTLGV